MADIEIAEVNVTTLAKEMITKPQTIPVIKDLFIEIYFGGPQGIGGRGSRGVGGGQNSLWERALKICLRTSGSGVFGLPMESLPACPTTQVRRRNSIVPQIFSRHLMKTPSIQPLEKKKK